ncbi:MAG: permease-like cell division protein FtsX [Flavobacteriales bacterium]|nr:permease-like cell division protein FtsX [Flavobacteriales bacterium]
MSKNKREKYERRRVRSSYISVTASTTLVLFILSLIGLLVLSSDRLSRHIKENFAVGLTIESGIKDTDRDQLIESLRMADYVKDVRYVSKEDALQTLKDDFGEDFVEFVGENPLSDKIEIFMKSQYANSAYIDSVGVALQENPMIRSIEYHRLMLDEINANIRTIGLWLVAFAGLFLVVSIVLINNAVRLAIYAKRFTIKTMQLVGATRGFISGPFVRRMMWNGLLSAVIALAFMSGLIYYLYEYLPEYRVVMDFRVIGILYAAVVIVAILLTSMSAHIAVRKFLRMKAEDLYY